VLRDYGNCSSATVLLILERMLARAGWSAATTSSRWRSAPGSR
jgi:predicted naringenin-chalcone synthase